MSSLPSSRKKLKSKELIGECMYYLLMNSYATPRGFHSNDLLATESVIQSGARLADHSSAALVAQFPRAQLSVAVAA